MRRTATALLVFLLCSSAMVHATSTGIIGYSGKDPGYDCTACHIGGSNDRDFTLAGPSTVGVGSTASYALALHGASGSVFGINVASSAGTLQAVSADTRVDASELMHRVNQNADDTGAVRFEFQWSAPEEAGAYTLFISAVIGNADDTPKGDDTLLTRVEVEVVDRSASFDEPPIARVYAPSTALVGEAVSMNATRSTDADGKIVSYEWDFGDGTQQVLQQATVQHEYAFPGFYTLQLIVTDDSGLTASASTQIDIVAVDVAVGDARPKANAGGPYVALAAETIQFDGGKSLASHEKGQIVSYEWDFGDGIRGSGEAPAHVYSSPGSYTATLTVVDDRGLPNSAVAQVTVQEEETPQVGMLRVPSRIAIWEGEGVPYPFQVTASVNGLKDGVTRCGVVYLKRNGEDYRHQTFCLTGTEERSLTFEHVFTGSDAPTVEWTAYAMLENGTESQAQIKTSEVKVFPAR